KFALAYYNGVGASYTMDSENQITRSSLDNKVINDFSKYEADADKNPSLKKYLDINRYILAIEYKLGGNRQKFEKLAGEIDKKNLTGKQRFVLNASTGTIKMLRKIKKLFLKNGIRLTTFNG